RVPVLRVLPLATPSRRHPRRPLSPYTTLFRSLENRQSRCATAMKVWDKPPAVQRELLQNPLDRSLSKRTGWRRLRPKPNPASPLDRKSTRLNSSHVKSSYAVFCLKKKTSETGR